MANKFHERFEIELGVEEGKRRFVNRTLNFIFEHMMDLADRKNTWHGKTDLAALICSKLGERATGVAATEKLIDGDFRKCLLVLEGLYSHPTWASTVKTGIENLLAESEIDIGVRWESRHFLPAGAPALDDALVNDALNLLNPSEYKGVADAFRKGLDHFLHSTRKPEFLTDVITDMYEALEALSKIVCRNDKGINANRAALIGKLGLHASYNKMFAEYIDYANLLARHAGEKGQAKPLPSRREAEAFMYLTGLFIRVALSKDS